MGAVGEPIVVGHLIYIYIYIQACITCICNTVIIVVIILILISIIYTYIYIYIYVCVCNICWNFLRKGFSTSGPSAQLWSSPTALCSHGRPTHLPIRG